MSERNPTQRRRRTTLINGVIALSALAAGTLAPSTAEARTPPYNALTEAPHPTEHDPLLEACPVDGDSTFVDSWGWARSGGRSHAGVDLIAQRGTPVIAVRDGDAHFKNNNLGGRAIWLTTDDGDRFYYAHLHGWEGESRRVEAGEIIGYVGSSGNAHGPHLHFETHPSDSVENPFPHTLEACVSPDLATPARAEPSTATIWLSFH